MSPNKREEVQWTSVDMYISFLVCVECEGGVRGMCGLEATPPNLFFVYVWTQTLHTCVCV